VSLHDDHPPRWDTDRDRLGDGDEVTVYGTTRTTEDNVGDGRNVWDEVTSTGRAL
jgi:hypothetical protein